MMCDELLHTPGMATRTRYMQGGKRANWRWPGPTTERKGGEMGGREKARGQGRGQGGMGARPPPRIGAQDGEDGG